MNDTLKGQLDLERHGGRTAGGKYRMLITQRLLAMAAAIWPNRTARAPLGLAVPDYLRQLNQTGITRLGGVCEIPELHTVGAGRCEPSAVGGEGDFDDVGRLDLRKVKDVAYQLARWQRPRSGRRSSR